MKAAEVVDAVRRHYGAERDSLGPEWAALDEFSLRPGAGHGRADLLMVRAWRSAPKRHERHAIEVKVSRADLLSELKNPHKSQPFRQVTHRFFLATPAGLVKDSDPIPDGWGLLEVSDTTARRVRRTRPGVRNDSPDPLPETATVEAFRRAARAESRTRTASADDPTALVVRLQADLAAANRRLLTAQQGAARNKRRVDDLLSRIATVGGFTCRCGARATMGRYTFEHADGARCEYGWAQPDLADLARRLGLDPESGPQPQP